MFTVQTARLQEVLTTARELNLSVATIQDGNNLETTRVSVAKPDLPVINGHRFVGQIIAFEPPRPNVLFVPEGYPDLPDYFASHPAMDDATGLHARRKPLWAFVDERSPYHPPALRVIAESSLPGYFGEDVSALADMVNGYKSLLHTIRECAPEQYRTHFSVGGIIASEADEPEEAAAVLAWLRSLHERPAAEDHLPDHLHNIAAAWSLQYVRRELVDLVASSVGVYRHHLAHQAHLAAKPRKDPGKHFGVVGERVTTDVHVDDLEQRPDNDYGPCFLLSLTVVPTGEKLSWWTGESCPLEKGADYTVRLTPKKHGDWDGYNVTTVSHVKIHTPPPPKEKVPRKPRAPRNS